MRPLAKGLLGDFQAVVGIRSCCSCAGYSEMLLEVMKGWPGRSRSDLENDLLIKNQWDMGAWATCWSWTATSVWTFGLFRCIDGNRRRTRKDQCQCILIIFSVSEQRRRV